MKRAGRTVLGATTRTLACLILLGGTLLWLGQMATQADAQSNVRPPAGAVQNYEPTSPSLRKNIPSYSAVPVPVEQGNVPGEALGNKSDSEFWRKLRHGYSGTVSIPDQNAGTLVQSQGEDWRQFRNGPMKKWTGIGLGTVLVLLLLFFLLRGRIKIEQGKSDETITRFIDAERMAHWLLAISFIILAITGLNVTFGKYVLPDLIGKEAFAFITVNGKWIHNYVAFGFMVALAMIFLMWVKDNIPNKYDVVWLLKGGGLFVKGSHPPSKKFNAGQKIIFWSVILGGLSLSLSGIALLFPFETTMFADTFVLLNKVGFQLPAELTPLQEMQLASLWHAIMSAILIGIVVAHIYIGSVGMEGAFDAMGSGEVDVNWAKEHHSIWAEKVIAEKTKNGSGQQAEAAAPAE